MNQQSAPQNPILYCFYFPAYVAGNLVLVITFDNIFSWESLGLCKDIQPVHPKGDQSWVFIGRTDVEAEMPILWLPDPKSWLIWKDPDAGKDWGQEKKGTTEDEMAGRHHWLNEHGFGWTPGVGDGQGGLACCSVWGRKELDTTEWLNWTELIFNIYNLLLEFDICHPQVLPYLYRFGTAFSDDS